jgi:hypothetical protein
MNYQFLQKNFPGLFVRFIDDFLIIGEFILNFFIIIFMNYNKLLTGKVTNKYDRKTYFYILGFFVLTYICSIYILGISRIYIV